MSADIFLLIIIVGFTENLEFKYNFIQTVGCLSRTDVNQN